ncbi:MAG: DUF5701 family protein [bacterium]|nr:DUF5701 family protein [bacterium]
MREQLERLVTLGVPALAGMDPEAFRALAEGLPEDDPNAVLAIHPDLIPASRLAPLIERAGKPGFVVVDMTDLDDFAATETAPVPDSPLYLLHGAERGDEYRNLSGPEAAEALGERGRSPLTVNEGISLLLHRPEWLEPNFCFMTIGSRLKKDKGFDSRTPAIWISGGTGRDGAENRDAPKVGWCWWNNRHTWLGFASAASRTP